MADQQQDWETDAFRWTPPPPERKNILTRIMRAIVKPKKGRSQ